MTGEMRDERLAKVVAERNLVVVKPGVDRGFIEFIRFIWIGDADQAKLAARHRHIERRRISWQADFGHRSAPFNDTRVHDIKQDRYRGT